MPSVRPLARQRGTSHFFGAEAAAAVFPEKDDADWFFLQTTVRF